MRNILRFLAVLAALLAASPAAAEVPEERFMYNKRCATCHDPSALMPRLMKLPSEAERRAYLEKFLGRHHARDAEERKLIVDYLLHHQPR